MLANKIGLVVGVSNKRSLAWGVATAWANAGARVHIVCQSDRFVPAIEKLMTEWQAPKNGHVGNFGRVHVCDVGTDEAIANLMADLSANDEYIAAGAPLDCVLHAVAHAPATAMKGSLLATSRQDFAAAHDASAYSLIALARHALPLMARGSSTGSGDAYCSTSAGSADLESRGVSGSITCLSFLGSTRAVPGYQVMGCAKASLEAAARGLALELGPRDGSNFRSIRVNVLSPGPVTTLASRGVRGFVEMKAAALARAPLRQTASAAEVGAAAAFLASDGAGSVTGQTIFLDGGLSAVAP